MNRFLVIALAAFAFTACGPRNIKLPNLAVPPTVAPFEQGINARTKLLDYEIPEVKLAVQKTVGMTVKVFGHSIGNAKQQQQRSFVVKRGANASLDVSCETLQQGARTGNKDFSKHTYKCGGSGFELLVDEAKRQVFQGSVRVGEISLDLESTDQMASGAPMRPSGFHIRRNGRWIASFEYYQFGNAYLGADLTADERDAVLVTMVSIQSTNHWLARDINQNQANPYGS
jgi:hypothetical protein